MLLVLGGGWYAYVHHRIDRQMEEAIAEADRLDPGWRLHELEARRRFIPDAENAALQVLETSSLLPTPWPDWRLYVTGQNSAAAKALQTGLDDLEPPIQLNDQQIIALRGELVRAAAALEKAGPLADLTTGRFASNWSKAGNTLLTHHLDVYHVAELLTLAATFRSQEHDLEGALSCCRQALNLSRAIGDEPILISQAYRVGRRRSALRALERTLAQGQVSEQSLAGVQRLLERDEAEPLFLCGLRGSRASLDEWLDRLQKGQIDGQQFRDSLQGRTGPKRAPTLDDMKFWWDVGSVQNNRAVLLRYMNRAVEIAKLPVEQQAAQIEQLNASIDGLPLLAQMLCRNLWVVGQDWQLTNAEMRGGIVMLAVERFRLDHGRWPTSLAVLVPNYLPEVPADPYGEGPLHFRRHEQGWTIYSIGPDRQDDGGKLASNRGKLASKAWVIGTDQGLRLWDIEYRRQPPKPPQAITEM